MAGPIFLPGETLSAAKLQQLAATATFTPTLKATVSNPSLGSGGQALGWHHVNGRNVTVWFILQFGTSGVAVGSGFYEVTGPPGYQILAGFPGASIGIGRLLDDSGSTERAASILVSGNSGTSPLVVFQVIETHTFVTEANPWTWAVRDILTGTFTYLTD